MGSPPIEAPPGSTEGVEPLSRLVKYVWYHTVVHVQRVFDIGALRAKPFWNSVASQ